MQPSERPDPECVRSAVAGDRDAFSVLVRRHQRALHRFLVRMLGSPDDALELTQEAFVRAWQALPQWSPDAQFRTWLFRIGRNAALDLLRRRGTVDFVPLDDTYEGAHGGAGPEQQAETAQELARLQAGLARLTPEHREIVLLREVENLSYEEIGRVLSLSAGTVKSRLARARATLVERIRRDGP